MKAIQQLQGQNTAVLIRLIKSISPIRTAAFWTCNCWWGGWRYAYLTLTCNYNLDATWHIASTWKTLKKANTTFVQRETFSRRRHISIFSPGTLALICFCYIAIISFIFSLIFSFSWILMCILSECYGLNIYLFS